MVTTDPQRGADGGAGRVEFRTIDYEVGAHHNIRVYVADGPELTGALCGELTMRPNEAHEFGRLIVFGQSALARLAAAERVVSAAREYVAFCETDEIGTTTLEGGLLLHALCNALAALTTGGDS